MSCKMCDFFEKSKDSKEKIEAVNNAILQDCKYKDIENMLISFRNDNRLPIPTAHFVKKHKANCLSGLTPKPTEKIGSSVNLNKVKEVVEEFEYTNIEKLTSKQKRKHLKDTWLNCACQLTDIIQYKLQEANPNNNVNLKDIVSTIKTLSDLVFFDSGKVDYDVDDENKINSINISVLPPADFDKIVENFKQNKISNDKK